MASLYRHLQAGQADHDRLPFRPDCPRCEHRLCGHYPDKHLLSRRQQALAATGLVAASSLLPAGSALADAHHPSGPPTPASPPAVVTDGGEGSGDGQGQDDDGWQGTPPLSGGGGDGGEASAPSGPESAQAPSEIEVEVPSPRPRPRPHAPRPAPGPQPQDRAGQAEPVAPEPERAPETPFRQRAASSKDIAKSSGAGSEKRPHHSARSADQTPAERKAPEPARANSPASVHVVAEGECLWSIAESKLGPQATNSQLATYVDQLWRLNAERIATGDPNLIHSGQRLRTPSP